MLNMSLPKPKAIMNLSSIPGSAEMLAAVRNICEAEKGLWRVIDASFGLPGFIDNGTYCIGRARGEYLDGKHLTERAGRETRTLRLP